MIIALTFANGDRRIDALDRLLDDVLRLVSDTRKRLIACDEWTRDQARRAAANAA